MACRSRFSKMISINQSASINIIDYCLGLTVLTGSDANVANMINSVKGFSIFFEYESICRHRFYICDMICEELHALIGPSFCLSVCLSVRAELITAWGPSPNSIRPLGGNYMKMKAHWTGAVRNARVSIESSASINTIDFCAVLLF